MKTIHLYYKEGRWQASGLSARLLAAYMPELVVYKSSQHAVCPPIEEVITRFQGYRMLVEDEHIEIFLNNSVSRRVRNNLRFPYEPS
ncbi:hypothetical protein [Parabacteroides gordonii]|uniref:hypothetical protein n=1 Tax=Parabacteroides gordonii TaxID=574930 RepID=UPI0026ECA3E6|nr:hypothetical protein [Parabacteroides gordonii]